MRHLIFVAICFIAPSYGMLPDGMVSERLYLPIIQKPSMRHDKLRIILDRDDITANQPWYSIVDYQKRGVCFDYAFMHILQITQPLKIIGCQAWVTELNALRFFNQVEKPQKNCLAIYTRDENDLNAKHVGVVVNDDVNNIQVRSKWGVKDPIVEHSLFTAPINYGHAAYFFALKEKYQEIHGKNRILQKIQKNIDQSASMKEALACFQNDFNRLAAGNRPLFCSFPVDNFTHTEMASILLRKVIGIDINGLNEKNDIPLISAIKRGNLDMVKLCIEYGADRKAKDVWGTTATQLADENGYRDIVQFLRQKRIKGL